MDESLEKEIERLSAVPTRETSARVPVTVVCPQCGEVMPSGLIACGECGAPLDPNSDVEVSDVDGIDVLVGSSVLEQGTATRGGEIARLAMDKPAQMSRGALIAVGVGGVVLHYVFLASLVLVGLQYVR